MRASEYDEDRLEFLGQVASWYYEDELDQSEIAKRIGKSRSMVSRLLAEARERELVNIQVRFPLRTDPDLEARLCERFGLSQASVLSGGLDHEAMTRRTGRLGARLVQSRLRSDIDVVIGWGAALHAVVRAMPDIRMEGVMVLQVMGSVGDGDPNVDGSDLARTLAGKLNGDFRFLAAPVIVDREEAAQSLLADRTIANTLNLARSAQLAVTGIGTIDSGLSGLVRAGFFDQDTLDRLRSLGVVGDLLGYLMDRNGRILDIPENRRVVALHPEELANIDTVIGVAGGAAKAAAIRAALRGGYLDALVTDVAAAESVLRTDSAADDLVEAG